MKITKTIMTQINQVSELLIYVKRFILVYAKSSLRLLTVTVLISLFECRI